MGAIIEEVELNRGSEQTHLSGVTCIFCGLPTPVHASVQRGTGTNPSQPTRHISLVRCEICGKEAPYLSCEVAEFAEVSWAGRRVWVAQEHGS